MTDGSTARLVRDTFLREHPSAAARALERCGPEEAVAVIADVAPEVGAPVVAALDRDVARRVLTDLPDEAALAVTRAMAPSAAAALVRGMSTTQRELLLGALPTDAAARILESLRYPPGTAGALLDPSAFTAPPEATVAETLERLRAMPGRLRAYVFVVARDGRLVGVVDPSVLIGAPADKPIEALTRRDPAVLSARATRAEILAHPSWADLRVLPVVDDDRRFLGVVRYRALRELEDPGARAEASAVGFGLELAVLCGGFVLAVMDELSRVEVAGQSRRPPRG